MASNPRAASAIRAMKDIGIKKDRAQPVLKKLLDLFDENWEFIEDENYRALADAIFEEDDNMVAQEKKKMQLKKKYRIIDEEDLEDEAECPLKRLRRRNQGDQVALSVNVRNQNLGELLLKEPKMEDRPPELCSQQQPQEMMGTSWSTLQSTSAPHGPVSKGKKPLLPQISSPWKRSMPEGASCVRSKPIIEPHTVLLAKQKVLDNVLIKPKEEPFTGDMFAGDVPPYVVPIPVIHRGLSGKLDSSAGNNSVENYGPQVRASRHLDKGNGGDSILASSSERGTNSKVANILDKRPRLEIASSQLGEVKISLSCDSALGRQDFHMPRPDEFIKLMEDKCLQTYKIGDPNFSLKTLLNDMCDCLLELGTYSTDESSSAAAAR